MAEHMKEEIEDVYGKSKSALKEKADSLKKEIDMKIDSKKNESYKEVELK